MMPLAAPRYWSKYMLMRTCSMVITVPRPRPPQSMREPTRLTGQEARPRSTFICSMIPTMRKPEQRLDDDSMADMKKANTATHQHLSTPAGSAFSAACTPLCLGAMWWSPPPKESLPEAVKRLARDGVRSCDSASNSEMVKISFEVGRLVFPYSILCEGRCCALSGASVPSYS